MNGLARSLMGGAGGLAVLVGALMLALSTPHAAAETCLSPFVKRLDRPEKYLYLFCVDADARDNDFVDRDRRRSRQPNLRHDHVHARPGEQGKRDTSLGLYGRSDPDLGRGACSRVGSGSWTLRPTRRSRRSRRCSRAYPR